MAEVKNGKKEEPSPEFENFSIYSGGWFLFLEGGREATGTAFKDYDDRFGHETAAAEA